MGILRVTVPHFWRGTRDRLLPYKPSPCLSRPFGGRLRTNYEKKKSPRRNCSPTHFEIKVHSTPSMKNLASTKLAKTPATWPPENQNFRFVYFYKKKLIHARLIYLSFLSISLRISNWHLHDVP